MPANNQGTPAPNPAGTPHLDAADAAIGPCLCADLPGTGGHVKDSPEDFVVEEIPAYAPRGEGEFLYLWIEKRDLSAEQLTSHLARMLGIAHQDVGAAGMKDRRAVTRQYVSVPARCAERLAELRHERFTVLSAARHANKLRPGHLKGNAFNVLLRGVCDGALERARAICDRILLRGMPNYVGEQRFGKDHETLRLGLDLLRGLKHPGAIPRARRKFLLRLALSSVQAMLFNKALAERMALGLLHRVEPGDVMQVTASGGPFVVEDAAAEQRRFDARETVIAGPMFGRKMRSAAGAVADREARLLDQCGLTLASFAAFDKLALGTRRPYLVWPEHLSLAAAAEGLRLQFTLPAGSYATILLREFTR